MDKKIRDLLSLKKIAITFAIIMLALNGMPQSVPPLINYQGRLTDQTGTSLATGLYGLQFRLWDSPTATNATDLIWDQQQNVSVQTNGVFNVILGASGGTSIPGPTPAVNNLAFAFYGSNCFLGVTVAISNSAAIASPIEILPRQQLLSVPYAVMAANSANAINASVATSVLPGSISTASLAAGAVTLNNIAPRQVGTNVGIGGLAISLSTSVNGQNSLSITINTTGRPVLLTLIPDGSSGLAVIGGAIASSQVSFNLNILRDDNIIANSQFESDGGLNSEIAVPPGVSTMIDLPPSGVHVYKVTSTGNITNCKLAAFEF